jgi:Tfp pilus assembly protein PilZ
MIAEGEDVSTTGIFVRCGEPFAVGTPVCVAMPIGDEDPIEVSGRVVRVGPGARGHVGMGIMFAGLDERSCAALRELVSTRLAPPS